MASPSSSLLVLDFDFTIATVNVLPPGGGGIVVDGSMPDLWSNLLENGFGGAARVKALDDLFTELAARGVKLAICSYNAGKVIRRALRTVGLNQHFADDRILAADTFEVIQALSVDDRWRKDLCISKMLLPRLEIPAHRVMFVDDDASHVADVASLPGAETLLVPPPQRGVGGMQAEQYDAIRRWASRTPGRLFVQQPEEARTASADRSLPAERCACLRSVRCISSLRARASSSAER
jgi:hypothetical protein